MEKIEFALANGMRILHLPHNTSEVSHCALYVKAGTRNEQEDESGLAHFIEHLLFKGTKKRKAFHILNRLEIVGGDLNAYTTKEETCLHASILTNHFERAVELLFDIAFNSTFPVKEIKKEKDVIIDEIRSYQDSPSEQIYDDFEGLVFKSHPLGNPILGTEESVKLLNGEKVNRFMLRNYTPEKIVFVSTGNIPEKKLRKIIEKYFSTIPSGKSEQNKSTTPKLNALSVIQPRETMQTHVMMGGLADSYHESTRTPMILLNNLLGGPGMNSRLNLNIREKYGITYQIESNYQAYSDTGLFSIYLATENAQTEKAIKLVNRELHKLREVKISSTQLNNAKQQLKGQLAMSRESPLGMMLASGKSLLCRDRVDTIEMIFKKIDAVTSEELIDLSNRFFAPDVMSSLIFESIKES